jgi:NAD(P)-dependent dehydrogenase (short-subunit alcohol dehydrogenase family)
MCNGSRNKSGTLSPIRRRTRRQPLDADDRRPHVPTAVDVVSAPDAATVIEGEPQPIDDEQNEQNEQDYSTAPPAPTTVIVVGAGSPEGVALVRGLSAAGHRVIAVDHDPLAAGLRLAPLGAVIPPTDDPEFDGALVSVVRKTEARVVLAPLVEDVSHLARSRQLLEAEGASVWIPSPEVLFVCGDPVALDNVLTSSGLPEDKTGLGPRAELPLTRRDFSVDVIVDRDYDLITAVSSWIQAKNGDTTSAAETFNDPRLLELLRAVCAAIRMEGPAAIQGYEADFRIRLSRICPGFSQFSPLARAAGVDVVSLALSGALGHKLPPPLLTHRSGVRMIQYLDQVFEG